MNGLRFEEAKAILDAYGVRLESREPLNVNLHTYLLEKRAWFFGTWCEYAEEQGNTQAARELREHAIVLYRQSGVLLSTNEEKSPLKSSLLKKRLARCLNILVYHLYRICQYNESLI